MPRSEDLPQKEKVLQKTQNCEFHETTCDRFSPSFAFSLEMEKFVRNTFLCKVSLRELVSHGRFAQPTGKRMPIPERHKAETRPGTEKCGGEELLSSFPPVGEELQNRRRFGHLKKAEERSPVQGAGCCSVPPVMIRRETMEARRNMRQGKRMRNLPTSSKSHKLFYDWLFLKVPVC